MARLAAFLERMPLRRRFLIAPLLGLLLLGGLTSAFVYELQNQSALLKRVADRDLAAYDRYAAVFVNLSEQHLALYALLDDTREIDEALLYDLAKQRLNGIHEAVRGLEQTLPTLSAAANGGHAATAERLASLLASTQAYQKAAASAVAMVTVNLALAPAQLAHANERFTEVNQAFAQLLHVERRSIRSEIAGRVHRGEISSMAIALAGVAAAAFLFGLSYAFSRLLARSLEAQTEALVRLGMQAGTSVPITAGSDEVSRIAHGIAAFGQSLLQLKENQRALAASNQALADANQALHSEIERRKEAEGYLRIYAEVIRSTGEAVAITDSNGNIVDANPAYERAIGRSREEMMGTALYPAHSADENDVYRQLWQSVKTDGHWAGELLDRRSNGESFPIWARVNTIWGENRKPLHYVCVSRDITTLKQSEQQLKKLAFYDMLTGLPNRALFNDRLGVALASAQRQQALAAVIFVDLDRFKYVNDTLGHALGDRLLIEVGRRIGRSIRETDTVARMGGDEFTVLLTHIESEEEAIHVAKRIIAALEASIPLDDAMAYVGASLGISVFPKDGQDAQSMLTKADMAMYEAKESGRGQYRLFRPEMLARGDQRLSLSVQIDAALKHDEFTLHYQPVIDMATGQPDSMEALIRWQRPEGMVYPEKFIPHAEEAGLIRRIDCWVLERACRDAMDWRAETGRPMGVRVHLSAASMQQTDMDKTIDDILRRTGLPASLLHLEFKETAMIAAPHAERRTLEEIAALGVRLSVDNFGAGYFSLSYLAKFPINCIKLDRLFIERIGKDKASEEVIQSLLELAHKLGLSVVAEGVEQRLQKTFLADAGCRLMQGFYFKRPLASHQLNQWLAANHAAPPV
ncbi:EAL domain-containing protein [Ramlibacter sp. 2FC]|uniref:EAL domain-containing protein n=1 Tax=Ramlibacter sp. 2FC TaxID=2502188 RepID=UPI0010F8E851|nr:EAL domain-containing protein [Ramlibacter sp. 2FC]